MNSLGIGLRRPGSRASVSVCRLGAGAGASRHGPSLRPAGLGAAAVPTRVQVITCSSALLVPSFTVIFCSDAAATAARYFIVVNA